LPWRDDLTCHDAWSIASTARQPETQAVQRQVSLPGKSGISLSPLLVAASIFQSAKRSREPGPGEPGNDWQRSNRAAQSRTVALLEFVQSKSELVPAIPVPVRSPGSPTINDASAVRWRIAVEIFGYDKAEFQIITQSRASRQL
jgi:hypothetical protein